VFAEEDEEGVILFEEGDIMSSFPLNSGDEPSTSEDLDKFLEGDDSDNDDLEAAELIGVRGVPPPASPSSDANYDDQSRSSKAVAPSDESPATVDPPLPKKNSAMRLLKHLFADTSERERGFWLHGHCSIVMSLPHPCLSSFRLSSFSQWKVGA
jgi:hypothetical protein